MSEFGSAASGAAAGSAFGPVGTVVGFLGGLLSASSDGIERKKRFRDYLTYLQINRTRELNQAVDLVGGQIAGTLQNARAAGARRAAAEGRSGDAESVIAPIEAKAQSIGSRAIREAMAGVDTHYRQATEKAYADYNDSPLPPNAGDWIQTVGEGLSAYGGYKDATNAARENAPWIPERSIGNQSGEVPIPENIESPKIEFWNQPEPIPENSGNPSSRAISNNLANFDMSNQQSGPILQLQNDRLGGRTKQYPWTWRL